MATTRARYREVIARAVGGWSSGIVDLPPDIGTREAQRLILSSTLTNLETPPTEYSYAGLWVGRYNEGRKVISSSYQVLPSSIYTPPATGPFTLTFWGYGAAGPLTPTGTADEKAQLIQDAIIAISGLESSTVAAVNGGTAYQIDTPSNDIAFEADTGTVISTISSIEASAPWRSALPYGTPWEMSQRLTVHDDGNQNGLNSIVNRALGLITSIAMIPHTPTRSDEKVITFSQPWIKKRSDIHAVWLPTRHRFSFSLTPPVSGSFDLSLDLGLAAPVVTSGLAHDASAETIATAIRASLAAASLDPGCQISGSGTFSVDLIGVYFGQPTVSVTAGSVSNQVTAQIDDRSRDDGWRFFNNGPTRTLELGCNLAPIGHTYEIEASIPAKYWMVPQIDWQTPGTTWITSESGLVFDLDQADADEELVLWIGKWLALEEICKRENDNQKWWEKQRDDAADVAAGIVGDRSQQPNDANARKRFWSNGRITKGDLV